MPKPDDWTKGTSARTVLASGTQVSGRFPLEGVSARAIFYRMDSSNLTSYIVYDDNGRAIKRVDLTGKAHAGIPTPHVLEYCHNVSPTGKIFVHPDRNVRPATPDEVP